MSSAERLATLKELGAIFDLDKISDILAMKGSIDGIINDLINTANQMPRNPCQIFCACSGACRKPEATRMLELAERLRTLSYAFK